MRAFGTLSLGRDKRRSGRKFGCWFLNYARCGAGGCETHSTPLTAQLYGSTGLLLIAGDSLYYRIYRHRGDF